MAKSIKGRYHSSRVFIISACLNILLILFIGFSFYKSIDGFDTPITVTTTSTTRPITTQSNNHSEAIQKLLTSIKATPPPTWATQEQITKFNMQDAKIKNYLKTAVDNEIKAAIQVINGQDVNKLNIESYVAILFRSQSDNVLIPIYDSSKVVGNSDSDIYDKLIIGMETFLATAWKSISDMNKIYFPNLYQILTNASSGWMSHEQYVKLLELRDTIVNITESNRACAIYNLVQIYIISKITDNNISDIAIINTILSSITFDTRGKIVVDTRGNIIFSSRRAPVTSNATSTTTTNTSTNNTTMYILIGIIAIVITTAILLIR